MHVTILNKIIKLNFILNIITYIKKLEILKLNLFISVRWSTSILTLTAVGRSWRVPLSNP